MSSNPTKVRLRVPTFGHKVGDVIEVESKAEADRLVANGAARAVEAQSKSKD